jgi:hypothetical protein
VVAEGLRECQAVVTLTAGDKVEVMLTLPTSHVSGYDVLSTSDANLLNRYVFDIFFDGFLVYE